MQLYQCLTYRQYLLDKMGKAGSRTGLRKRLAEAIPVHGTFVSQVLKGKADFSPEQAESINLFFQHDDEESEFFFTLLMKDRAGTERLKSRLERKLQILREAKFNIQKRLDVSKEISNEDRERYYSSWIYGAVYILVAIPQFQNIEALSSALKISRIQTKEIVDFLLKTGVILEQEGSLIPGSKHIHIGNESELILKHHSNWRFHALSSLQLLNKDNLHFSSCLSLSMNDVLRVKESMLGNLKHNVEIISASKEEVAYVMNLDFYRLIG